MIRVGIAARPALARDLKRFVEAQASMKLIAVADDEAELAGALQDEDIDVLMSEWRGAREFVAHDTLEIVDEAPKSALTPREIEVLQALADGASNKEIARALGISFHTAKFHVAAILEKLDAATRTEAVTRAARLGIVMI
ncbi:MAG: LuxR C-terminal-related transcriptional regulator [Alphaproteobacteria bacterium]